MNNTPLKIFISYSHEDEKWKDRLQKYLNVQVQLNKLIVWDDREIRTGDEWNYSIEKAILESDIAILLVTVDFLNSSFIQNQEIPCIQKNNLKIMPLILSPCAWDDFSYISMQQGFTKNNQPLEELNINKELNRIVKELCDINLLNLSLDEKNNIDLECLKYKLTETLFWDEIDVNSCILTDNKTMIEMILRQIWNGNRGLIHKLKGMGRWFDKGQKATQCSGLKDILSHWNKNDIKTFIFYIPRSTTRAIRKKLVRKMNTKSITEKIERYIITESNRNLKNMLVYNLDDRDSEIEAIFDIQALKEELDKNSEESEKIFFIGLKYNLSSREVNVYLNNTPIAEESGLILGNSKLLKHKLKKGIIEIGVEEDVIVEFFDTNIFTSKDDDIGKDLEDIDFERDNIEIELDDITSLVLESKKEKNLIFSRERNRQLNEDTSESFSIIKDTKVNMDSFFIPKTKDLKRINLLLLEKDGQNIIAGGQYYSALTSCNILAELNIDFEKENICLKNHSDHKLFFSNYEDFWKFEDKSISSSSNYNTGIYTEILSSSRSIDGLLEVGLNIESTLTIEKGDEYTFDINEIEFNDSNVSFDKSGVLIQYSSFCIAQFDKEFSLHRTAYKMSDSGTIIDCFVRQPSKGVFQYGGRIFDNSSKTLGVLISSKPISLRHTRNGLEIDVSKLVATMDYIVKIVVSTNEYFLEDIYNSKKIIKKNEMKNVEIGIMSKNLKKPLIEFSLEFN